MKIFISVLLVLLDKAGFSGKVNFETLEMEPGQIVVADDVLGWTFTPTDVQEMLNICEWWSNQCGSTFSSEKSNIVMIGGTVADRARLKFTLYGEELQIVEESEHLGVPVTRTPVEKTAIAKREKKTRRAGHASIG